jgi:hypothetical protein
MAEPCVRGVKATMHGSAREIEIAARLTPGRWPIVGDRPVPWSGLAPEGPSKWAFGTYAGRESPGR